MAVRARQEQQLLRAIAYFLREKFPQTFEVFAREAQIDLATAPRSSVGEQMDSDTLSKRWAATARMQAKLTSQEQRLASLQQQLQLLQVATGGSNAEEEVGLPSLSSACSLSTQKQAVNALCFDCVLGKLVVGTDDGTVRVFTVKDASNATLERSFKAHGEAVTGVACDESGRWLATSSVDSTVRIFDVQSFYSLRQVLKGHEYGVSSVCFLPEESLPSSTSLGAASGAEESHGLFILSGSRDGCVRFWEVNSGACLKVYRAGDENGATGLHSRDSAAQIESLSTHRMLGFNSWIRALALPPVELASAKVFATAGGGSAVLLWRVDRSSAVRVISGHSQVVECLAFASEATLRLLLSHQKAPQPLPPSMFGAAVSRSSVLLESGLVLFSAGRDCVVKMWDVWNSKCMATFVGHDNWIRQLLVHPNGRFLLSAGDDKSIRIWDVLTGDSERVIPNAHSNFVTCLSLDARRGVLASAACTCAMCFACTYAASLDATVRLWSLRREVQGETPEEKSH